jgi:ribosomal protein S27AE
MAKTEGVKMSWQQVFRDSCPKCGSTQIKNRNLGYIMQGDCKILIEKKNLGCYNCGAVFEVASKKYTSDFVMV